MTTNPNDYDPNELRRTEEAGGLFIGDTDGPVGADEVLRSSKYRELYLLERAGSGPGPERPYLATLPQSYAAEVIVYEWLEYLVDKAGFRNALDVLRYYRSIEWITADVESRLREYLTSFEDVGGGSLDHTDHLLSLVYVARLAAMA